MSDASRAFRAFCRRHGIQPRRGPALPEAARAPEGEERYAVLDELGEGSFGRVMLAVDRDLRRAVALKQLSDEDADLEQIQAFVDEAVITGGLEHPNIVPAYELGYDDGLGLYYTMKRLPGRSLRAVLDGARASADGADAGLFARLGLFREVCRAVAHAHDRGVVHTDLKPENVLIGERGEVLVADWGEARLVDEAAADGMISGTPRYMSPEQARGEPLDARSDVWSLGVMLYELLTLQPPFDGADEDEIIDRVLLGRIPRYDGEDGLSTLCWRALRRPLGQRLPDVQGLLDGVDEYLDGVQDRLRRSARAERAARAASPHLDAAAASPGDTGASLQVRLAAYRRAVDALRPCLETTEVAPAVGRLAARIYWEVFETVYPGRRAAPPAVAEEAVELLSELMQAGLLGIVREGQSRTGAAEEGDPWLRIVRALGDDEASPIARLAADVALLASTEMFTTLAPAELLPVAHACHDRACADAEALFAAGDTGDALYVIRDGAIDILIGGQVVQSMGPGAVLGEISALSEAPRTAGAVARGATSLLQLDADRFRSLVARHGELGLCVIDVLTDRLRIASAREADLRRG